MSTSTRALCLVTGASSGIGRAIAGELARRGDRVILVARDAQTLTHELDRLHGSGHELLAADLQDVDGLAAVAERLVDADDPVDVLVHSAGAGLPPGGYLGNPLSASTLVRTLSVDAETALVRAALPGMLKRGRGGVITVGSIAGFLPGSPAITYAAAKAWAHAFGEGLHELTRGTGVTSTVVAPGFVRSGFHDSAGLTATGIHGFLWLSPTRVARSAVRGFERHRALVIPGVIWKGVYALTRITPRSWSRTAFAAYMAHTGRRASR